MLEKIKKILKMSFVFWAGILVSITTISVFASWPSTPEGEIVGGWLGNFFDFQNSTENKLLLNANKADITENKQVVTREYVESRVLASGITSSSAEAFCIPYGGQALSGNCPFLPGYSLYVKNAACCWLKDVQNETAKRIFVTSVGYTGDLGGEIGADAKCQARANAANLDGTFKAWFLDGTNSSYIYEKFSDTIYVNILGHKVITTFLNYESEPLGFSSLESNINYDEFRRVIDINYGAWTNLTSQGGVRSSFPGTSCFNFTDIYFEETKPNDNYFEEKLATGFFGNTPSTSSYWYSYSSADCDIRKRLICVEV